MLKKFIALSLGLFLMGCNSTHTESVSCKVILAVPDHATATIQKISDILVKELGETKVTGWTIYPVYGAWRPGLKQPFIHESSIVIEMLGESHLIQTSHVLAEALESVMKQEDVLVYCSETMHSKQ